MQRHDIRVVMFVKLIYVAAKNVIEKPVRDVLHGSEHIFTSLMLHLNASKCMPQWAERYEYWGKGNLENEGVQIAARVTQYGVAGGRGKRVRLERQKIGTAVNGILSLSR